MTTRSSNIQAARGVAANKVTKAGDQDRDDAQHHHAQHMENTLDEALDETFPASDPIACTPQRTTGDDKKMPVAARPPSARQSWH